MNNFSCSMCGSNSVEKDGGLCASCKFAENEGPFVVRTETRTVEVRTETESRDTGEVDETGDPIYADYNITYSRDDVYNIFNDGSEELASEGAEYVSGEGWGAAGE
jgi:hypothetical protein